MITLQLVFSNLNIFVPPILTLDLTWTGGCTPGYPSIQTWDGGTPCPDLERGTPSVKTWEWGIPILTLDGVTPSPHPDLGNLVPPVLTWGGVPPLASVNRQTPVKTVPSLVLRTRALKIQAMGQHQWLSHTAREWERDRYRKLGWHHRKQWALVPVAVQTSVNISV